MPKKTKSVLVVEDEQELNNAYRLILERAGYSVATASDGHEAIDQIKKSKPDVILLDLKMPNLDGLEFLKKFKPKKKLPNTKIVLFSNYDLAKEIDEAYLLGADKYVLKAWASPRDLIKIVEEITSN